jgi:ABC-type transport system substrate-binding protein
MVAEAQLHVARIDRRTILTGAAAAAGATLLPQPGAAQAPRGGGILRVAIPFNPGAIEPMTGRNLPDFNVLYAVFDNLIDFDPLTLDLKPGLATAWRWTTPTTLVVDLVEGVTFHDGSPFNADAVCFNLERRQCHC